MELPAAAAAMYKNWWWLAYQAATATNPDGSYQLTVAQAQEVASIANRDAYGGQGGYNPPGFSQLFSIGRKIANASRALGNADDSAPITPDLIGAAPWGRSQANQDNLPLWEARVSMTYTDSSGVQHSGEYAVIQVGQNLPASVGRLRQLIEIQAEAQLANAPGVKSPRSGTLDSIDSIQLLAI